MVESSKGSPKPKSEAASPATAPAPAYWSARGNRRGQPRLKLLGAARGAGALIWSGGSIAAAYELDVFGSGEARSASGSLEGDFSTLPRSDPDDQQSAPITGARLRLEDGHEIAIAITVLEPDVLEFEAQLTADDAGILP